jgi:hypothetical protein
MGIRDRKVNRDKMLQAQQEAKARSGTSFFRFKDEGQYLLYLPPPCREEDEDIYLDVLTHNIGRGKDYKPVLCLDTVANLILADERMIGFLETPVDLDDGCPRCAAREKASNDEAKRSIGRKHSYYMNVVLMGFRKDKRRDWDRVDEDKLKVQTAVVGSTVWDGIIDVFLEDGDICDPSAAIFIVVTRTGKGQKDTEYKVSTDRESLKNPVELPESLIEKLEEALQPGGSGDLYRVVARDLKSPEQIAAMMSGKKVDVDEEEEEGGDDEPPACFKLDYQNDDDCGSCPFRGPCSKVAKGPHKGKLYEGHELQPGDLGYEGPEEETEEELETETEVEEEEEPDPPPSPKKPASNRPTTPPPGPKPAKPSTSGKPAAAAPKPPPKDPAATDKPKKKTDDEKLADLGYDAGQIGRMRKTTKERLIDERIPADCASILKSGAVSVFYDKLPTDHPLYEEKEVEETEEEPETETEEEPDPPPPARKTRGKAREPEPETEVEEEGGVEVEPEDDGDLPEEPGEGGGEAAEGDGDDLGLDELERELNATAGRTRSK